MSRTVDVDMGHGHGHAPARPAADRPRWLAGLDTFLGFVIEIPAALLVLAEIVVLLAGVISRYVFHSPIIWSDELASILFLWLAMLGAVVAFRRGEHMRMTALVGMAVAADAGASSTWWRSPRALAFLFCDRAGHRVRRGRGVHHDAGARNSRIRWRAAALPVGIGADAASSALLRLLRDAQLAPCPRAAGRGRRASSARCVLLQPVLRGLGNSTC